MRRREDLIEEALDVRACERPDASRTLQEKSRTRVRLPTYLPAYLLDSVARQRAPHVFLSHPLSRSNLSIVGFRSPALFKLVFVAVSNATLRSQRRALDRRSILIARTAECPLHNNRERFIFLNSRSVVFPFCKSAAIMENIACLIA